MALRAGREIDFLIIGAAKSATTWLQLSLSQSPYVFMPGPELHFFSREYDRGMDWYRAQFEETRDVLFFGEKSNSYLTHPQAAQRIASNNQNIRLIVQLRDPVERAYSDYCMLFRRGEVNGDIRNYLDPTHAAGQRFLNNGRYALHLSRFYDLFPAENILLLTFEGVKSAPHQQLEKVGNHIGLAEALGSPVEDRVKDRTKTVVPTPLRKLLKPFRPILDPVRESAPIRTIRGAVAHEVKYPELPKDLEARMIEFFRPDNELLRKRNPEISLQWKT